MIWLAITTVVAAACILFSVRRLRRLARGIGADAIRWSSLLSERRSEDGLGRAASADAALAELLSVLRSVSSHAAGVAELNDRALELDRLLAVGAEVPRAASRISSFTGTACAILVIATTHADASALGNALTCFAVGLSGGIGCATIGRAASGRARAQRNAWTAVSRSLERVLPAAK